MNNRAKFIKSRAKAEKFERMYNVSNEMRKYYEELFSAGVGELRFKNMAVESLLNALSEICAFTDDKLAKKVAEMAKERYHTDVLIHARLLFK